MDIKKLLIGGIIGGILYFLLGWLTYGMLLTDFMKNHPGTATGVDRAMDDFQYLYLVIANLAMGFLLAYVFVKSSIGSMASGLVTGGVIGLLVCVGFDSVIYATTNIVSKTAIAADVAAFTIMSAIVGAAVGMVMGMGKKAA